MADNWCLEVREHGTDKLVNRWEPMSEKRANALGLLILMGLKDGLYTQLVKEGNDG